jgi:hypothetical protein
VSCAQARREHVEVVWELFAEESALSRDSRQDHRTDDQRHREPEERQRRRDEREDPHREQRQDQRSDRNLHRRKRYVGELERVFEALPPPGSLE